jgi:prepilin-type N-terminal cleavage/methylation domain-containing protein
LSAPRAALVGPLGEPAAGRPRRRRSRGARGFSLVEAMVAASVLAIGAAAVLASYATIVNQIEHQRRLISAVNVTQGKLEVLLSAMPHSALLQSDNGSEVVDQLGRRNAVQTTDSYLLTWTINHDVPTSGYMEIVVQASWNETGGTRTTKFSAYREE